MGNLRSAKSNIELQDGSRNRAVRSVSKVRKAMTIVLAAFIGIAIVTWIGVLTWGAFAFCRWGLSFFFSW
jgi:uncharacterized membrane protein YcjF (UPF0283 family)